MSSDPHQGGSLSSWAEHGTSIPNDAGIQNTIRSVPNPHQKSSGTSDDLGYDTLAAAADNPSDIPRQPHDTGATGQVISGTGDQLPAEIETKRLHVGPNDPASKGHGRYHKHMQQKESDFDRFAGDGPDVTPAPGEEDEDMDVLRDRKDMKETR